jgi:hypothetical protein
MNLPPLNLPPLNLPPRMSKESIADRGYRSDGPVDLDDLDELYEHEQEQYTSSFHPVSHNSIVSGKNNNVSLPHCRAIAATNNNTSNKSDSNINGTIDGKNKVQSNNSTIIDSLPRLQSMLNEAMNDKLKDWARRHQKICSGSGSGCDSNISMSDRRDINASGIIIKDTTNGKDTLQGNNGIHNNNNNSNNNSNNSVSTNINSSSPISISSSNNNNNNNVNNNSMNNNNSNVNNNNNNNNNVNTSITGHNNSMGNISNTGYNSNVYVDPKIDTESYPPDTYSILALHGPIENPAYFSFGLMVYLFQMTFLILMVLSVVHRRWSSIGNVDNPDAGRESLVQLIAEFVPSQVTPLVRTTQIMATLTYIIFADSTIRDIVLGVELFPHFKHKTPDDKVGCMLFSSVVRLSQGISAIIVTLFLIVTTSNVIEIILNFTAVNFISNLDNHGFEIIKWGKYGTKFKDEAYRIEKLPLPQCINKKHKVQLYWYSVIPIGAGLIACLCGIFFLQESNYHWVTKIFRVQFQDKEQGLQVFNGCYEKNDYAINRKEGFRRKLYEGFEYNAERAQFGYCIDDRRWILFKGNVTNACEARGNKTEVAHSSKTDTFDVSTMFGETWYSSSNTPLDAYFVENNDTIELNKTTCSSFIGDGNCDLFFNTLDYKYDGGDCCAGTCSGPTCGIGLLKNAFGTTDISGDGFPNCVDPAMVPLTLLLDDIISSIGRVEQDPVKPLLFIDCDKSIVLSTYMDASMENKTETIMVNDGADCTFTIRNDFNASRGYRFSDADPIWYVRYVIFHGDKHSVESNSIMIAQSFSGFDRDNKFRRIPECLFSKLSDHIDNSTVYTAIYIDPSAKAIDWLMNDESENSMCEDSFFLERYALSVISFANPSADSDFTWISDTRQCVWPSIKCDNGAVVDLDLSKLPICCSSVPFCSDVHMLMLIVLFLVFSFFIIIGSYSLTGSIPSEIGLLTSLEDVWLGE